MVPVPPSGSFREMVPSSGVCRFWAMHVGVRSEGSFILLPCIATTSTLHTVA